VEDHSKNLNHFQEGEIGRTTRWGTPMSYPHAVPGCRSTPGARVPDLHRQGEKGWSPIANWGKKFASSPWTESRWFTRPRSVSVVSGAFDFLNQNLGASPARLQSSFAVMRSNCMPFGRDNLGSVRVNGLARW